MGGNQFHLRRQSLLPIGQPIGRFFPIASDLANDDLLQCALLAREQRIPAYLTIRPPTAGSFSQNL
jgi:hypothetical protein